MQQRLRALARAADFTAIDGEQNHARIGIAVDDLEFRMHQRIERNGEHMHAAADTIGPDDHFLGEEIVERLDRCVPARDANVALV
jgi:hypothetical protein